VLTVVHYEFHGAVVETGWRGPSPITHEALPQDGWVWFGHHHLHQNLAPRAWVIGTPLQHTRSDETYAKGFVVFDLDRDAFQVVYTTAPTFRTLRWADNLTVPSDGNFYRITHVPASKAADLRHAGVVVEAVDDDAATGTPAELTVTVSDLPGALRRFADAGLIHPSHTEVRPEDVLNFSATILEKALAGEPLRLEETI